LVKNSKPIVALFGGSFDPPHKGHQKIVLKIISILEIENLIIVPAYLNPFKTTSLASASLRLQWCQILFESIKKVKISEYEVKQKRAVRTFETVQYFNHFFQVKYLVIGADSLKEIEKWSHFKWLNSIVTWIIMEREGYICETHMLKKWKILALDIPISSTQIRTTKDVKEIDSKIKHAVLQILKGKNPMKIETRINNILEILNDKKAQEIEVFNLDKADYIAKKVVIANSLNGKHTLALFDYLKKDLKEKGDEILASDVSDDWVVADLGDILIHIMVPEYRQRYSLESFLNDLMTTQNKNLN